MAFFSKFLIEQFYLFITLLLFQSKPDGHKQLENIVRQEGEIYLAIEKYDPQRSKNCRIEDVFINSLLVRQDSLSISYRNYTESFCEAFVLNSQFLYQIHLGDIDPSKLVLAQRKYNYGSAKLLEGEASWFEILITARQDRLLVKQVDLVNRQSSNISSIRIIFKTKEGATKALGILRQTVQETR